MIINKLLIGAGFVIGIATPANVQRASPAAPPVAQRQEAPNPPPPDPLVDVALARAADRLAVDVEADRLNADLLFQLGRLDAALTAMEHGR